MKSNHEDEMRTSLRVLIWIAVSLTAVLIVASILTANPPQQPYWWRFP